MPSTPVRIVGRWDGTTVSDPVRIVGGLEGVGGAPAIMVAASDASAKSQELADYVCDGAADEVQINAAITALPEVGGIVQLSEGTFNLTTALVFPSRPVILSGCSVLSRLDSNMATVLNFALGAGGDCITFTGDHEAQLIQGLAITGDETNTNRGIYVPANGIFKATRDVLITGMVTRGIETDTASSQCRFENTYARDGGDACMGFAIFGVDHLLIRCQAARSAVFGVGGLQGYKIGASGSTFISCVAQRHWRGFEVSTYAAGISLFGCYGELNDRHIRVDGSVGNEPEGINIVGFYGLDLNHATQAAVYIDNSFGVQLKGIHIQDSTSNKAIETTANADTVTIEGGWTNDTTPLTDGGATRLKVTNFYPLVTENKGTGSIANGTTSDVIAHGLDVTPTVDDIMITLAEDPTNSPGAIWVDTIGAANFTVNCENDPGASNLDFGWRVAVL